MFPDLSLKDGIILGLALALVASGASLLLSRHQLGEERAKTAALQAERDQAKRETAACRASLNEQNAAVEAWKGEAQAATERAKEAAENARKAREDFQGHIARILTANTPKEAGAALAWATDEAARIQAEASSTGEPR